MRRQGGDVLRHAGLRELRARQRRRRAHDHRGEVARRLCQERAVARSPASSSPAIAPPRGGLYLLDVVPDGEVRFGFPNINDNAEIAELIACGSHVILFSTGRGSVVGSAISPVIKVCANPETYRRMSEDMDVDAGRILEGRATLEKWDARCTTSCSRSRRRAHEVRSAGPSGVHPHLQELRAARPGLPAWLRPGPRRGAAQCTARACARPASRIPQRLCGLCTRRSAMKWRARGAFRRATPPRSA